MQDNSKGFTLKNALGNDKEIVDSLKPVMCIWQLLFVHLGLIKNGSAMTNGQWPIFCVRLRAVIFKLSLSNYFSKCSRINMYLGESTIKSSGIHFF